MFNKCRNESNIFLKGPPPPLSMPGRAMGNMPATSSVPTSAKPVPGNQRDEPGTPPSPGRAFGTGMIPDPSLPGSLPPGPPSKFSRRAQGRLGMTFKRKISHYNFSGLLSPLTEFFIVWLLELKLPRQNVSQIFINALYSLSNSLELQWVCIICNIFAICYHSAAI